MNKLTKTKTLELIDSLQEKIDDAGDYVDANPSRLMYILANAEYLLGQIKVLIETEEVK